MATNDSRHVLITGVSRGLGRALVDEFVAAGHRVTGCARSTADIRQLTLKYPAPHQFATVDVSEDDQVAAWAGRVLDDREPPDLLINNAAIVSANRVLWETDPADFSRVMEVNVNGVHSVIRHFVPAMVKRGSGVIVNFSSGWGRSTSPQVAPYCASKWAIEGLTRALADELPYGMAAIPLNPGIIDTALLRNCFGEGAAAYPSPASWAKKAVPFLLDLGPDDNGDPLTAP